MSWNDFDKCMYTYPPSPTKYRFLNSGTIIGYVDPSQSTYVIFGRGSTSDDCYTDVTDSCHRNALFVAWLCIIYALYHMVDRRVKHLVAPLEAAIARAKGDMGIFDQVNTNIV